MRSKELPVSNLVPRRLKAFKSRHLIIRCDHETGSCIFSSWLLTIENRWPRTSSRSKPSSSGLWKSIWWKTINQSMHHIDAHEYGLFQESICTQSQSHHTEKLRKKDMFALNILVVNLSMVARTQRCRLSGCYAVSQYVNIRYSLFCLAAVDVRAI